MRVFPNCCGSLGFTKYARHECKYFSDSSNLSVSDKMMIRMNCNYHIHFLNVSKGFCTSPAICHYPKSKCIFFKRYLKFLKLNLSLV